MMLVEQPPTHICKYRLLVPVDLSRSQTVSVDLGWYWTVLDGIGRYRTVSDGIGWHWALVGVCWYL